MAPFDHPILKVADQARHVLHTSQISDAGPGTILSDMQSLLSIIDREGFISKSKQGNLPPGALPEINRQLSAPITLPLNRALLRDYPNIAGLYALARVMDLVRPERGRLRLNPDLMSNWDSFNPTEKYFALLEAWLLFAEDAVLGGSAWTVYEQFDSNLSFLINKVTCRCWKTFDEWCHTTTWGISTWNVHLQTRFGLIEAQPRRLDERDTKTRGWLLKKAKRTPWGEAVAWAIVNRLVKDMDEGDQLYLIHRPEEAEFGFFQPVFAPYFPGWKRAFKAPEAVSFDGRYIFKVTLDSRRHQPALRVLAVPSKVSLDSLAYAVLKAFNFYDFDHLYEFRFSDRQGKLRKYYHPYTDEGPYGPELTVGETGFAG